MKALKPWREIARPHHDVLAGTFKQSEFAADITQVARGKATPEYQDAVKFFERTYITEGMRLLLSSVAQRLVGRGGDPVIQLQTNFGGGKTHTLLAVYHLASRAVPAEQLPGIRTILDSLGLQALPTARIAVIDGINLSPNQPTKRGSLTLHTVWGHIAYQLLGDEGYARVADSDAAGTAPGKEVMIELLQQAAPCVLLLDELVAFYRQLEGGERLAAGSLESNMSFIQVLTESVKAVPNAIVLASLPESDTEAVGTFGQRVLTMLEKYFGRLESVWKPVAADESFEIVRRRLFEPMTQREELEAVCREFADYYRRHRELLPQEVQEARYEERLRASYPIHPEVFDRLYQDWSTLDKFQRTRGVLQYLAIIIHRLWNDGDAKPLIMPGTLPLHDPQVRIKSVHYLPQGWDPIIDSEIDGDLSLATRIDNGEARFGSIQAARRAARTIFLGSAPSHAAQVHRGLAVERILLGCAIPDDSLAIFQDVLKRLQDRLQYLFVDLDRFWFDTRPNLRREMESRKSKIDISTLKHTLLQTMQSLKGHSHFFSGVHVFTSAADIPDDLSRGPRLVVLAPEQQQAYAKTMQSRVFEAAREILEHRGEQPRLHRNRLFFVAPDMNILPRVHEHCRMYLAWQEIVADVKELRLNLDRYQANQAEKECESTQKALALLLADCYCHILIPRQEAGTNQVDFEVRRLKSTSQGLAPAVEKDLTDEEVVIRAWSPKLLNKHLEETYFKNGQTEVLADKVWEDCCSYYQMPRLLSRDVLDTTICAGIKQGDLFGFAAGKDGGSYQDFAYGEEVLTHFVNSQALLIQHQAAEQFQEELAAAQATANETASPAATGDTVVARPSTPAAAGSTHGGGSGTLPGAMPDTGRPGPGIPAKKKYQRFWGSCTLDSVSGMLQFQNIMEEIISQFTMNPGVTVSLNLEIEATSQTHFDDKTVRTVKENGQVLKMNSCNFEEE